MVITQIQKKNGKNGGENKVSKRLDHSYGFCLICGSKGSKFK